MSDPFPADYAAARDRFRRAAGPCGRLESVLLDGRGPTGEELALDIAGIGPDGAGRLLVLSAGLHGVEAPFGSAVLTAWLEADGGRALPADTAVLLLHALNPFGYAWRRRVAEDNVDLNRNFLLPGQEYRGCPPTYAILHDDLNPNRPPPRVSLFALTALLRIAQYGGRALRQAIAGGQYDYPKGLFFGGHGPAATHRLLAEHLPRWVGSAARVLHLDFHTGLGRWGEYELLIDAGLPPERHAALRKHFGDQVARTVASDIGYETRGSIGEWCQTRFRDRAYDFLCAEFGTYAGLTVLEALRAENQAHHWTAAGDPRRERTKRRLQEVFVPRDRGWRETVLGRALALVRRALE